MRTLVLAALGLAIGAARVDAFCGFYVGGAGVEMFNHATQVVLMRHGTTTVLSMQNNYQGPPEHFALVVPVPVVVREDQVKTLDRALFDKVDRLGAPRLVEYWERDPCERERRRAKHRYDDDDEDKPSKKKSRDADDGDADERVYHVKVEAEFSVGEYDIVVLSAKESTGLDGWLRANHYEIPKGAAPLLRPYIEQGTKFFVAKVDPKKVRFENGMATLSPLRFHYESPELALPIRLGLANADGPQDLIVNILAPNNQRYEVANYPNVTIPTNLHVRDEVRTRFGEFYAALFDDAQRQVPNAVVTEYAWSAGSCDPCPGPTLAANDVFTLGGDVLAARYKDIADASSYTLTRLHARYAKDVKDDLVFRAVKPIAGGRGIPDESGNMSTAVSDASTNNFQGRYVILHPWDGAVTCEAPRRGRWGGPHGRQEIAKPARDLAFAPRGNVQLASLVADPVPVIGAMSSPIVALPTVRHPQGCGCGASGDGGVLVGIACAAALRRRRRAREVEEGIEFDDKH